MRKACVLKGVVLECSPVVVAKLLASSGDVAFLTSLVQSLGRSTTSNFTAGSEDPMRNSLISHRKKPMFSSVWLLSHSTAARCSSRARFNEPDDHIR